MADRPLSPLRTEFDRPLWRIIDRLFEQHRLTPPPTRLRDELVNHLIWARYGEALDASGTAGEADVAQPSTAARQSPSPSPISKDGT